MAQRRRPDPSPLGEAAEGFTDLAQWFAGLVGDQVASLARAVDSRELDADVLAAATARAATLPWLGWSALVNELFDAATVLTERLVRERTITSPPFHHHDRRTRRLLLEAPLVNGFCEELVASQVRVVPPVLSAESFQFELVAADVPAQCVGVYRGRVRVVPEAQDAGPGPEPEPGPAVDVWLVVS